MTIGFGQGIAVAPLQLAMGYATLFDGGIYHPPTILKIGPDHPLPPGPARVHRRHQLPDALAPSPRRDEGHRQEGRRAGLSHRRQDRHRAEADQRPLQPDDQPHELRRCVPDGRPALCDRRDARRTQGHPGNLRLHDGRLERRAGRQPHRQPDRADARRGARHESRTEHGRGACRSFRTQSKTRRRTDRREACATSPTSIAIPK